MKKALFAFQEHLWLKGHRIKLEEVGFVITECRSADEVLPHVRSSERLDLVVMEIILPHGESYDLRETDDGMKTGVLLYRDIRAVRSDVPIIIFSTYSEKAMEKMFPEGERPQHLLSGFDTRLETFKEIALRLVSARV